MQPIHALACKANQSALTLPLDMLNDTAIAGRRPHVVCHGAPTNHDLTWLIVGADVSLREPWDEDQDFMLDLPARALLGGRSDACLQDGERFWTRRASVATTPPGKELMHVLRCDSRSARSRWRRCYRTMDRSSRMQNK